MKKKSILHELTKRLADEHRRILSDWRAAILLRRATDELPLESRRWERKPSNVNEIRPTLSRLAQNGELVQLPDLPALYEVKVPYADTSPVEENELLMELHPYGALSYLSAFVFHELTNDLPQEIHMLVPSDGKGGMLPVGTTSTDWEGMALIRGSLIREINQRRIHWHRIAPNRMFGYAEYVPHGYPIRVTTPERTLLDGLQQPEFCGGLSNVLRAWRISRDTLNFEALIHTTEQFDIGLLRQRVGYVLEELGLTHPILEKWQASSHRGGSSKLLGAAPFAPTFSERWKLSINAPISALHED